MRTLGARAPLLLVALVASLFVAGPAAAAPLYPHQSLGDRGADVRAIQGFLRQRGSTVAVDGVFGATTEAAVQMFQREAGLQATGRVGEVLCGLPVGSVRSA